METWEKTSALIWDVERLRIATDAAGVALWSWNVDTDEIALDDKAHVLWAVPRQRSVTFEQLSANIHPEDLDRVRSAFAATRKVLGAYEIDFRILSGDNVRWISARGRGDDIGIVGRIMFGVFLDVTERKRAEEAREIIAAEMSHRVKNLLAIASALTAISARSTTTTSEMAQDLTRRLVALGRAHNLVQPGTDRPGQRGTTLKDLLPVLLAPYAPEKAAIDRINIAVPETPVGQAAVTSLALIIHELATNSIKYGALAKSGGVLNISALDEGDNIVLTWEEIGVEKTNNPPGPPGFGSKLISESISNQLGGTIVSTWTGHGLVITLTINQICLSK